MRASKKPRLITIPISHYCEKARWALDRAGVEYSEERHIQSVHWFYVRVAGGGWTAPVLKCKDEVFPESADILAYADRHTNAEDRLYPGDPTIRTEVQELERYFDEDLGPHGRRWMYFQILDRPDLVRKYNYTGVSVWEQRIFKPMFPVASRLIEKFLNINPRTAARSFERVQKVFDEVGARIEDGRLYLCGDRFTAADLAFAALSASVLSPQQYGVPLPTLEEFPDSMAEDIREFRAHPAGKFALRMYETERTGNKKRVPEPSGTG